MQYRSIATIGSVATRITPLACEATGRGPTEKCRDRSLSGRVLAAPTSSRPVRGATTIAADRTQQMRTSVDEGTHRRATYTGQRGHDMRLRTRTAMLSAAALIAVSVLGAPGAQGAPAPPTPPDAPAGAVTTYQVDASHDGLASGSLSSPLHKAWTRDLGATVGYPLVVNGRVFVLTERLDSNYGTRLWALDAKDGSTIWGPLDVPGTYFMAGIAADGANVYVVNEDGVVMAHDQATGELTWATLLRGQWSFTSPPTVRHGVLYVEGAGDDGTLYAVSTADGRLIWSSPIGLGGDHSSPAVTDDGVFVSFACGVTYRFDPADGHQEWARTTGCFGGGGSTPVVHDDRVYVRDTDHPAVLDAATGAVVAPFAASMAPAFEGNVQFSLLGNTLSAVDLTTGATLWSQTGDGHFVTAPIVVGSDVAIGSTTGQVSLVNEQSGDVDWSGNAGSPITFPDEVDVRLLTGLAASDGRLFVPASHTLVAYEHLGLDQAIVTALYKDFLGRVPDRDELGYWEGRLRGATTGTPIAPGIAFSDEAASTFVASAYESILRRPADHAGLRYWSRLPGGMLHANRIIEALYASDEYLAHASGNDDGWVQHLYQDILDRPAQLDEIAYWVGQAHRVGRKRVASAIVASQEAADLRIDALSQQMLGRPADDSARAALRSLVERLGTPLAAVAIADTSEYATHALTRVD